MAKPLPPSVYVSRLRRAFFLRVHPDRFRSHDASTRQRQAKLVQSLNDRMSWPDFLSYNTHGRSTSISNNKLPEKSLPYALEHRDGRLLQQFIRLDDSVENILASMAKALRDSGAKSLPPPPPPPTNSSLANSRDDDDDITWVSSDQQRATSNSKTNIDHRFDINTTKGRDLLSFCQSLDRQNIEQRRQSRMDANAAALMGRRLYQFSAIDGTSLHWSSHNFAQLLRQLVDLHEEHHKQFHVKSFYPLRLVFTNNDLLDARQDETSLDLYGGNIYLHPGYTPLQWLTILQQVTPDTLEQLQNNRAALEVAQRKVASILGVKFKKGFTCNADDYYEFALQFAHHLPESGSQVGGTSAVALEPIHVVVESADACRLRSVITPEGNIRVGKRMSVDQVLSAIHRDSGEARMRREVDRQQLAISKQQAKQVQWELGLTRQVFKAGIVRIPHEAFQSSLRRIVQLEEHLKDALRVALSGNALGIAGTGQFCHLGDDGAVIIPHDWSVQGQNEATERMNVWSTTPSSST